MHGRAVILLTVLAVSTKCNGFISMTNCDISKLLSNPRFCGSDGKTYTSFCKFENAKAKNQKLRIIHVGSCRAASVGYDGVGEGFIIQQDSETSYQFPYWNECISKRGCSKGPTVVNGGMVYMSPDGIYVQNSKDKKLKKKYRGNIDVTNDAQNNNNINSRGNYGGIKITNEATNNNNFNGGGYYGDINVDNEATNNNNINARGDYGDIYIDNEATNNNNFNRLKKKTRLHYYTHQNGLLTPHPKRYFKLKNRGYINIDNDAKNNNNFNGGYNRDINIRNQASNNNNFNRLKYGKKG